MENSLLRKSMLLLPLLLITTLVNSMPLHAQTYSVSETLEVSYDGTVHVKVEILITEPGIFTLNVTLHKAPEGLLVYDENNMPLNYEVLESKIKVFMVNNTKAYIEYLSRALTRKEGPVWTISFTFNDGPVNIVFPEGTSILDITGTPKAIKETEDGRLIITFEPGRISVDYVLPILTVTPTPTTPPVTPIETPTPTPTKTPTPMPIPYNYLPWIIGGSLLLIALLVVISKFRR